MTEKLVKKDLNTALFHIRVMVAAPYDLSDKMDFIDLKEDITELISTETEKKERVFKEKNEAVFEQVRKEVNKQAEKIKAADGEFKNKEALISSLLQDHPTLSKIQEERNEFWGLPVINKIPFIIKPELKSLPGDAKLISDASTGALQSFKISRSFDWLVEHGFIEVSSKTNNKNGTK